MLDIDPAGLTNLAHLNPHAARELVRRGRWAQQMRALLPPERWGEVEAWVVDKDEDQLEAARLHLMTTGAFPPPA